MDDLELGKALYDKAQRIALPERTWDIGANVGAALVVVHIMGANAFSDADNDTGTEQILRLVGVNARKMNMRKELSLDDYSVFVDERGILKSKPLNNTMTLGWHIYNSLYYQVIYRGKYCVGRKGGVERINGSQA